jgi:two-component system, LytTR family, sensor kinase
LTSLFLASLLLRLAYRSLLQRDALWRQTILSVGVLVCVVALPCGAIAEWTWISMKGLHVSLAYFAAYAWGDVIYAIALLASWSGLYLWIKHYREFQMLQERARQAEMHVRDARLNALRYQLNPHFLFNTLNAVSSLVVQGHSAAANRMLVQLANFLRSTLYCSEVQEIPLHREIVNTQQYLDIEKARLGERLELEFSIAEEVQTALVPPLFLQPLVENAIRHGIAPNPKSGKLTIKAQSAAGRVRVTVSNNGIAAKSHQNQARTEQRGFGLANTMERFRVLYGPDHRVVVHRPPEGGCRVEIEFPYREESSVH